MDYITELEEQNEELKQRLNVTSHLLHLSNINNVSCKHFVYTVDIVSKDNEQLCWCNHLDREVFFTGLYDLICVSKNDIFCNFRNISIQCKRNKKVINNDNDNDNDLNGLIYDSYKSSVCPYRWASVWNSISIWQLICVKEKNDWIINSVSFPYYWHLNNIEQKYEGKKLKTVLSKINKKYRK